jgi:hypothetical protein
MQNVNYRAKCAAASAAAVVAVGVFVTGLYKPGEEPIMRLKRQPTMDRTACLPVKGDMKCEVAKGEADPASDTFDEVSCGLCGDGIRQVTAAWGRKPVSDSKSGIVTQDVTERPSETPQTCPVDFHCGNRRPDFGQPYGAWIGVYNIDTGMITYTLGIKTITETSRTCPADVRTGTGDLEDEDGPDDYLLAPVKLTDSTWECPGYVAPMSASDMTDMYSSTVWSAFSRVDGAISRNSKALREALGADGDADVAVRVTIRVEPEGNLILQRISATCSGAPCGTPHGIINATNLSLDGLALSGTGMECFWTLTTHPPKQQ